MRGKLCQHNETRSAVSIIAHKEGNLASRWQAADCRRAFQHGVKGPGKTYSFVVVRDRNDGCSVFGPASASVLSGHGTAGYEIRFQRDLHTLGPLQVRNETRRVNFDPLWMTNCC